MPFSALSIAASVSSAVRCHVKGAEALALGVPVVASDAVGNPEVVEPEWGTLYPAGDRRALAEALGTLLARPGPHREAMGRAGRAFAERALDLPVQTARLHALFARSVRPAGPSPGRHG